MTQPRVVEKYYSTRDLELLIGFGDKFWRQRCQNGELTLKDGQGNVISEPAEISGELRIPASAVNAYLIAHPYRYDAGVKARNTSELRRKLNQGTSLCG